jgi:hypothetical protein
MTRADFAHAVHHCLPVRPTRTNAKTGVRQSDEYGSAETIAAELFRRDFEDRHRGAQILFTAQRDYLSTRMTGSIGIEFFLNMMKEHFRNWASPRNPMREGGFRKPDGMCIAANGRRVRVEVLEVKPFHGEADGRKQMEDMLRRLRAGLNEALQTQSGQHRFVDEDFEIEATEWRPRPEEMVCPLLNPASAKEVTWACFNAMARRARAHGVVLYELHALSFKSATAIPPDIGAHIRTAYENSGTPAMTAGLSWRDKYCAANPADIRVLRTLAAGGNWAALAAGLAVLLSGSKKAAAAASAAGSGMRTLLESSRPLSVSTPGVMIVEPAIREALVLTNLVRKRA